MDSTTFILLTRSVGESESILKNISGVKSVKLLKSDFLVVVLDQKNDQVNQLKNNNTIKGIGYSYLTTLNRKIIPTGEILVQTKRGNSISSVISKYLATLSIQSVSVYGDFILKVENKANILEIANSIYENGIVTYKNLNKMIKIIHTYDYHHSIVQ